MTQISKEDVGLACVAPDAGKGAGGVNGVAAWGRNMRRTSIIHQSNAEQLQSSLFSRSMKRPQPSPDSLDVVWRSQKCNLFF